MCPLESSVQNIHLLDRHAPPLVRRPAVVCGDYNKVHSNIVLDGVPLLQIFKMLLEKC